MLIRLQLFLASVLTGQPAMLTPAAAGRARRGATFIEYMLLAAIAVVLGLAIWTALGGSFDGVLQEIQDALNIRN